jgi:flagellar motor protein MotB
MEGNSMRRKTPVIKPIYSLLPTDVEGFYSLAELAAIKEEERGLVVTLSGNVLFRSSKSTLLSSAQTKLDQVANALLAVSARNLPRKCLGYKTPAEVAAVALAP